MEVWELAGELQSEEEAVAEDEAAFEESMHSMKEVLHELVSAIRHAATRLVQDFERKRLLVA